VGKKMRFRGVANGWMRVVVRDGHRRVKWSASVIFCFIRMRARLDAIGVGGGPSGTRAGEAASRDRARSQAGWREAWMDSMGGSI
jgi:hypothetical protein